jgi:tRNA modification GTPase
MPRKNKTRRPDAATILATAPGPSGLAVLQVVGRGAVRAVAAKFSRPMPKPGALAVGRLVDEVVVRVVPAKETGFGEPIVEISCHGGKAPAEAVMAELGLPRTEWASVLDGAVKVGKIDRLRAEARLALPHALTEAGARALQAQVDGALTSAVKRSLKGLLPTATAGLALTNPPRVAIVGRANAGKSTLFNAVLGRERALVSPVAGTTRDPVDEVVGLRGIPVRLIDTAGLLPEGVGHGILEQLSLKRTREEIERAALLLFVRDATASATVDEAAFERWSSSRRTLTVWTKIDLVQGWPAKRLGVSGRTGAGLDRLGRSVLRTLGIRLPRAGGAVVFTERQRTLLEAFEAGGGEAEIRRRLLRG